MRILFLGDIFGPKGIEIATRHVAELKRQYSPDLIIANIENSGPKGKGICEQAIKSLSEAGCDIFTGGNHSFFRKETYPLYSQYKNVIRPCNFPSGVPGNGYAVKNIGSKKIVVVNVQLRGFMREQVTCPFKSVESILQLFKGDEYIFFIDVHGETTSEKLCFGYYFDGMVSAIVGTHTHVQTADERVLPKGTAYITDVGMTGALNSSIGEKLSGRTYNLIMQIPTLYEIEESGPFVSSGVLIDLCDETKKSSSIKRLYKIFEF